MGPADVPASSPRHPEIAPVNEEHLRPRRILEAFSRLYPEAWRQVDDLRVNVQDAEDLVPTVRVVRAE